MNGNLDPRNEITVQEVAALCGVSVKTLRRDHDDPNSPIVFIKRGSRNFVTIAMLTEAARFIPGSTPVSLSIKYGRALERITELEVENLELRERLVRAEALFQQADTYLRLQFGAPAAAQPAGVQ